MCSKEMTNCDVEVRARLVHDLLNYNIGDVAKYVDQQELKGIYVLRTAQLLDD